MADESPNSNTPSRSGGLAGRDGEILGIAIVHAAFNVVFLLAGANGLLGRFPMGAILACFGFGALGAIAAFSMWLLSRRTGILASTAVAVFFVYCLLTAFNWGMLALFVAAV